MIHRILLTTLSILALLGLTGCAKYRARPLNKLGTSSNVKNKPYIAFDCHAFTKADCLAYLDRDVLNEGYQPVQIEFVNNSERRFRISSESFSFPLASPEAVARLVHTDTVARAVGYGVVGLFIWPFIIPAIVDGIGSAEANEALDTDFAQKGLRRSHEINAFGSVNGLIFVPINDYYPNFTFTVVDIENNQRFVLSLSKPRMNV